jgi:hypothetical protein
MDLVSASRLSSPVYCQHCRFFLEARRPAGRRCLHAHARYWVETPVAREQRWRTPHDRNRHHDCPDFRVLPSWEALVRVNPAVVAGLGLLSLTLLCVWSSFAGR